VVKDEGAKTGILSVGQTKKLVIDFNCLGTEIKAKTILTIEVPLFSPIKLYIDKECKKEDFVDILRGKIGSQGIASKLLNIIYMSLFAIVTVFMTITLYNLCNGKELSKAVPCGGDFIASICGLNSGTNVPKQTNVSEMTVSY